LDSIWIYLFSLHLPVPRGDPSRSMRARMLGVKRPDDTLQMHRGSSQHEAMKDLMRAGEQVKRAGPQALGHARGVYRGARNVQRALAHEPVQADVAAQVRVAVDGEPVEHGHDGREAHGDEEGGAQDAPFGPPEGRGDGDVGGGEANDGDLRGLPTSAVDMD
jgi:hypothetical protein